MKELEGVKTTIFIIVLPISVKKSHRHRYFERLDVGQRLFPVSISNRVVSPQPTLFYIASHENHK
jgi:hypothetical protein